MLHTKCLLQCLQRMLLLLSRIRFKRPMCKMQLFLNMSKEKPNRTNPIENQTHTLSRGQKSHTLTRYCTKCKLQITHTSIRHFFCSLSLFHSHTTHRTIPTHPHMPRNPTQMHMAQATKSHTHIRTHTVTHAQGGSEAVMGNVIGKLKTSEPLRIPFGAATCQVLDQNKVKCLSYS